MKNRAWQLAAPFSQLSFEVPLYQRSQLLRSQCRPLASRPLAPLNARFKSSGKGPGNGTSIERNGDTASGQQLGSASSQSSIPAHKLSENVTEEEKKDWNRRLKQTREQQVRQPWHRDGVDEKPADAPKSESHRTKGKLLTTPSRLLKLIMPLQTSGDTKDTEPLALLVHPQQPLSYLERLIQAEIPSVFDKNNNERIPSVNFCAEDRMEDSIQPKQVDLKDKPYEAPSGKYSEQEHPPNKNGASEPSGHRHSESSPHPSGKQPHFVRWSKSVEIGDFIRDAARGKEFAVEIEGAPEAIMVGVPSFTDRTHYLRMRLRSTSRKIASMADLKKECDTAAHKAAQRVAMGGFAGLCGWWYLVYLLTFETELGWDVMEPVTYLVGLSTLIAGYMWFLYHNREVSYQSAMKFTVSRRQSQLYEAKGFDVERWEALIEEGNALRREIKAVATEYDVEWDELGEEKAEKVREALREGKKKKKRDKDDDDDKEK